MSNQYIRKMEKETLTLSFDLGLLYGEGYCLVYGR